ncbi:MAG: glycosyltransferase family 2 protein [Ignavibacteriae bacterium]|nr:glycosyltransferase family 2 protein [Ignavibacteriota bacterium]
MTNEREYDIAVAYRIYPGISKKPEIFPNDKWKLSELCLRSFRDSLGTLRAKVFVILDRCPPEYKNLFLKYFSDKDVIFIEQDGIGNARTFALQIQLLLEQTESEYIYFAEDDYFYLPDQFKSAIGFLKEYNAEFVTLYDHSDSYSLEIHNHLEKIVVSQGKHWRTTGSTCLSFLTTKSVLRETKSVFATYSKKNYDASIWFVLTKRNVFNPVKIIASLREMQMFKIYGKAWFFCFGAILFGKKRTLWNPIPSGCTHIESGGLAPTIDWQKEFKNVQDKIDSL